MDKALSPFTVYPGGLPARADSEAPSREYQELWFSMARLPWASLVLVPADHGGSAAEVATALADFGSKLRDTPVTAIVANRMDYASARALADLQPRLRSGPPERPWLASVEVEARPVDPVRAAAGGPHRDPPVPPMGRAIIAVQPVVDDPLGIAIAQAADAVVLCVELGKTRMPAARRTIALIGAERVIGAVLVR
jgi:hypothetical protein